MICPICLEREANAVGSHIISHFLLQSMTNDGVRGRDREQSFQITNLSSQAYFGRRVSPETIEETMGRPFDESDATRNHYVEDNIFCTVCEHRLAVLESRYNERVEVPLAQGRTITAAQQQLAYCFWLTMFFRCAVTQFTGFRLPDSLVSELQAVTNNLLADSSDQLERNCQQQSIRWNLFTGYFLPTADSSRNTVLLPSAGSTPSLLTINQYVVVFDFELDQVPKLEAQLGVSLGVQQTGVTIRTFTAEERETLLHLFHAIAAQRFLRLLAQDFVTAYQEQHGDQPAAEQVERFIDELTAGEEPATVKYAEQRIEQLTQLHIGLGNSH